MNEWMNVSMNEWENMCHVKCNKNSQLTIFVRQSKKKKEKKEKKTVTNEWMYNKKKWTNIRNKCNNKQITFKWNGKPIRNSNLGTRGRERDKLTNSSSCSNRKF